MKLYASMLFLHYYFHTTSTTVRAFTTSSTKGFALSGRRLSSSVWSSKEWSTNQVRETFNEYFQKQCEHTFVESSPVAPLNDPTLLFTNAGMNQFKPIFLGQVDPSSPMSNLKRAVNSQKCIRAGGKHNDLEDVGKDSYHHTFFEMLGSWSFGDYFKAEAIDWAWKLLTQVYGLDEDRLYATYFGGDEKLGLEPDLEARDLWLKVLPAERVLPCDAKDNFWEMGDQGPCGPCTEVHYDRIGNRDAASLVNADDPNVIEIWNLVFIQYNRDESGLNLLPNKHVDTGMGLERLVSILQGKTSNYDIDCFTPIFDAIEKHAKNGAYTGKFLEDDVDKKDTAYRAIADHARTLSFAIADGAIPSNEGRGYVLRRIFRRAARYGQQILKAEPGFFSALIPTVVDTYGSTYPELVKNKDRIIEVIQEEEQAFSTMLDRGIKYFTEEVQSKDEKVVGGDKAFYLYDTLGFPIDLTTLMAEEAGLSVDVEGFDSEMEAQKQRSRAARLAAKAGGMEILEFIAEQTAQLNRDGIKATDDSFKFKMDISPSATIEAIYNNSKGFFGVDDIAVEGDVVGIVLDKSSFYAEAGGQEADIGTLTLLNDNEEEVGSFTVTDVQTYGGYLLHTGIVESSSFSLSSTVKCKVDYERRRKVTPNHTMTHVLNAALREIVGDEVEQRGSLCNDEKLRFDFSHKKALTQKELKKVEDYVNNVIEESQPVTDEVMPLEDAKKIDGVRAVFGEVYPDPVRVVAVGGDTSVEFCGGTHLTNSAEAEAFCLIEETAVAKGIRRITAVTRDLARQAINDGARLNKKVSDAETIENELELEGMAVELRKLVDASFISAPLKADLRGKLEILQKKAVDAKKKELQKRIDVCLNVVKEEIEKAVADGQQYIVLNVDIGADSKASNKVIDVVKKVAPEMAFMGISEAEPGVSGGKVLCFTAVPENMQGTFGANEWVKSTLESFGGRGGGKPGNAQGQAPSVEDVNDIIQAGNDFAADRLRVVTI